MSSAQNSSVVWVPATEGDRLFQCGIVWGKRNSSWHHCMSAIYNIEHYVMVSENYL